MDSVVQLYQWLHRWVLNKSNNILKILKLFPFFLQGLHQWNIITWHSRIFKCNTKSVRSFGNINILLIGCLFRLATTCYACFGSAHDVIRNSDLYSRNTELFSSKRTWWRCISVIIFSLPSNHCDLLVFSYFLKFLFNIPNSSLQWLRGPNKNVELELDTIRSNIRTSRFNKDNNSNLSSSVNHSGMSMKYSFKTILGNIKSVLKNARLVRPVLITCGLMIFQRFTGKWLSKYCIISKFYF